MLLKLKAHISNCLELAANAEQRAIEATDPAIRDENEMLAKGWRLLARSYEFVEGLERFLSDAGDNKQDVLPPEMLALIEDRPTPPESKPIIRRPRIKHATSFKDRLLQSAKEAREQAARLPAGPKRERLLLKARQSETAADVDTWISSPGSTPPKAFDFTKKKA